MELMSTKFQSINTAMKKKSYDFLDQRKADFDVDYDDFKLQIAELHVSRPYFCATAVLEYRLGLLELQKAS